MLRPCMVIPTLASDGFQLDNGHMMMPWPRDQLKKAFLGKAFVPGKKVSMWGVPWWLSGYDLVLSLPWPWFNTWLGN